jgi:hypothetical protein
MELPEAWLSSEADAAFVDGRTGATAPAAVRGAVLVFTGGELPPDLLVSREATSSDAVWRVAWVARNQVGFVSLRGGSPEWDAESEYYGLTHVEPVVEEVWVRPLGNISAVSLTAVNAGIETDRFGRSRRTYLRTRSKVSFIDGGELQVPLFEGRGLQTGVEEAEKAFLEKLLAAMG